MYPNCYILGGRFSFESLPLSFWLRFVASQPTKIDFKHNL